MLSRFLLILLATAASCRPEPMAPEPEPTPAFSGISPTDFNGAALGDPDTTDWRLDDAWLPAEAALFPGANTPLCASPEGFTIYPAYPNPCGDVLGLGFVSQPQALWDFVLVDEKLVPLRRIESFAAATGPNSIQIDLSSFPKDTLRLYYRIRSEACVLRGHGDILRQ